MNLDEVATELYGLDPEQFTAGRNGRAKEATAAGDRVLAGEIRKLGKPTAAAWLANGLVRTRAPDIEELIGLGPALRRAQSGGQRAQMKEVVERRRALIRDLVRSASATARESSRSFGGAVERQLEETLEAAVADPVGAEGLRRGRLTEPLRFVGFGESSDGERGPMDRADNEAGRPGPVNRSAPKAGAAKRAETGRPANAAQQAEKARPAAAARRSAREALDEIEGAIEKARARQEAAQGRLRRASKLMEGAEAEEKAAAEALRKARGGLGPARRRMKRMGDP